MISCLKDVLESRHCYTEFICKKCEKLEKNVKCWADVLTEKEHVININTIPFPYEHICVLSGIEIMKKKFEG